MPLAAGDYSEDRWPDLYATMSSFNDPPAGMTGSEGLAFEVETGQTGGARALAQLEEFLAEGPSEEQCRDLLDRFAGMYQPTAEFAGYRDCLRWTRDRLRAGAAKRPWL